MDRHKVSILINNVVLSIKAIMSGQIQGGRPDGGNFCVPLWCFALALDISIKVTMLKDSAGGQTQLTRSANLPKCL